jgi:hypothetical protein
MTIKTLERFKMELWKNKEFWAALSIIVVAVCLMIIVDLRWIRFVNPIGPFRVMHWFVWIGTLYIAFVVPTIAILKKRSPSRYLTLLRVHVFGNLMAFLLVSLHFASQISRSPATYPQLGTGLALYIIMIFLVASGFAYRFQLIPQIKSPTRKFIHVGLFFSFYIIIGIHILHGLNFI